MGRAMALLTSVFGKTLHDRRRSLIAWSLGLALLTVSYLAFWPSVQEQPGFDEIIEQYPEALRAMFNIDDLTSPEGFLNTELFSA
jgi:ABC-2 type transport system permease protein